MPPRHERQNAGTKKPRTHIASRGSRLAAEEGFEPSQTESESVVLPLHNSAPIEFQRGLLYHKSFYLSIFFLFFLMNFCNNIRKHHAFLIAVHFFIFFLTGIYFYDILCKVFYFTACIQIIFDCRTRTMRYEKS